MQSLATLSEEKARIETSFQADRKVMLVSVFVRACMRACVRARVCVSACVCECVCVCV